MDRPTAGFESSNTRPCRGSRAIFSANLGSLREGLGLDSIDQVVEWLGSRSFRPYFDEFLNAMTEFRDFRCPQYTQVYDRLVWGDGLADQRFSGQIDKTDWEEVDHWAYFVRRLTDANRFPVYETLFGQTISIEECNFKMHQAAVYAKRAEMSKIRSAAARRLAREAEGATAVTRSVPAYLVPRNPSDRPITVACPAPRDGRVFQEAQGVPE